MRFAVKSVGRNSTQEGSSQMEASGLLVRLEARSGKEADAEAFLKSAQPLAQGEQATLKWYAIKLGPGKFGIFDTFAGRAVNTLQFLRRWKKWRFLQTRL